MAASGVFFENLHPVDGYIRLSQDSGTVQLDCRWPFDLEADDYIYITNEFMLESFSQAVRDALENGYGKSVGVHGGSIEISESPAGFVLDFSNAYEGWQHKSLRIRVGQPVSSLQIAGNS